jgi:hypothetical protein
VQDYVHTVDARRSDAGVGRSYGTGSVPGSYHALQPGRLMIISWDFILASTGRLPVGYR